MDDGWLAIGVVAWVMAAWEMGALHAIAAERAGPVFAVGLTALLGRLVRSGVRAPEELAFLAAAWPMLRIGPCPA